MAKPRNQLSGAEIESLRDSLDRQLDRVGIQTQPEVAMRVLELVSDPESSMQDFADVIGTDPGLSGRLLRLANSAYYAQRKPVTALNRACVVVGLERLRAIVLGFYLYRAVSPDGDHDLGRVVWAQSLFRACLCAGLARKLVRRRSAEAFVIGLMLDCGLPLSERILGAPLRELADDAPSPQTLFCREMARLPFTHVDVATVLCRRWELPDVLADPICTHHVIPKVHSSRSRPEELDLLRRIAFAAGAVKLHDDGSPVDRADMPPNALNALSLDPGAIEQITRAAADEYRAVGDVFAEFADNLSDLDALAERVHIQLQEALDSQVARSMAGETEKQPLHLVIDGCRIEIEPTAPGEAIAYLTDVDGERVASHGITAAGTGVEDIIRAFALEEAQDDKIVAMARYIASLAA